MADLSVAKIRVVEVALTVDTSAYAANDSLAEPQLVTDFLGLSGLALIHEVSVQDNDDQGVAFDLVLAKSAIVLSSSGENTAITLTDAHAADIIQQINIVATDYNDNINSQNAYSRGLNAFVDSGGLKDIWIGAIARGTATYAGAVITVRFSLFDMK